MSLGQLDASHRDRQGPLDLLAYAQQIIEDHISHQRDDGWGDDGGASWVCFMCDARLNDREAEIHTAHQLWIRGVLGT